MAVRRNSSHFAATIIASAAGETHRVLLVGAFLRTMRFRLQQGFGALRSSKEIVLPLYPAFRSLCGNLR